MNVHCSNCKKLIGEAEIKDGWLKLKCKNCAAYTTIEIKPAVPATPR